MAAICMVVESKAYDKLSFRVDYLGNDERKVSFPLSFAANRFTAEQLMQQMGQEVTVNYTESSVEAEVNGSGTLALVNYGPAITKAKRISISLCPQGSMVLEAE